MSRRDCFPIKKIQYICSNLELDLSGLTVLTELASGAYLYNIVMILLAGAKVICVGKDSTYGEFIEIKNNLMNILGELELKYDLEVYKDRCPAKAATECDIVTNSGLLRPIDNDLIRSLKETAVICLMWETWEFRDADLDIKSCQNHNIPVIGTNENFPNINMFGYNIFIAFKLLFSLNLEIYNNQLVVFGSGPSAEPIIEALHKLNCDYLWVSDTTSKGADYTYFDCKGILDLNNIDALLIIDHSNPVQLIGREAGVNFIELKKSYPDIKVAHISGNIDVEELKRSELTYFPDKIMPFSYMSYQCFHLGPQPVLELFAAGLKVGEIAAKARKSGDSISETILKTVKYGVGQDFKGGFMNYRGRKEKLLHG